MQRVKETAFSNVSERQAAHAHIEKEITAWKQEINKLSLISRLSPELLSVIFKMVRDDYDWDSDVQDDNDFDEGELLVAWVPCVSHVCSHWRNVALECPSLWVKLQVRSASWFNEKLERSKMAPLTVYMHFYKTVTLPTAKIAIANLHRIKSLSVYVVVGTWNSETFRLLMASIKGPAPLLHSLNISCPKSEGFVLPLEHAPLLKDLSVKGCDISHLLEHGSLDNLTKLKMSAQLGEVHSVTQVLSALCRTSKLEELYLKLYFTFPIDPELCEKSSMIPSLPNLRSLHLKCNTPHCVALLDHIHFGSADVTLITRFADDDTVDSHRRLLEVLRHKISGHIISLKVLKGHRVILRVDHNPASSIQVIDISLTKINMPFLSIVRPLPLQHLKFLEVQGCDRSSERNIWKTVFADLPSLETINLSPSRGFVDALSSEIGSVSIPKFQALRNIILDHWVFDNDNDNGTWTSDGLIECFKTRRQQNAQLNYLKLDDCVNIERSFVKKLKRIATEVVWYQGGHVLDA